jgi:hypothetical protein
VDTFYLQDLKKKQYEFVCDLLSIIKNRSYDEILYMYKQIESLTEEKEEICEKLFLMQENFIRKLD